MAGGNIIREDIRHEDIVDAVELESDGLTSVIFTGATLVSTTSGTKTVVLSGVDLERDPEIVEAGDIIILAGTSGGGAADGTYTVAARIDDLTFTVNEAIATSTGGTCETQNPSGASKVGFDDTGLTYVDASNVQDAIEDLDASITSGGALHGKAIFKIDGGIVYSLAGDALIKVNE
ncbi:MAG: hypothetical protein KJN79_00550 [Gammaproteobacteria bacterium]|nr:hypothetical protein [Gammaproteobacteria bacterium]